MATFNPKTRGSFTLSLYLLLDALYVWASGTICIHYFVSTCGRCTVLTKQPLSIVHRCLSKYQSYVVIFDAELKKRLANRHLTQLTYVYSSL